jgi:Xaa-Pro dipeptidase
VLNQFDVEEMVSKRVCYYFMPHGVGHLLGLDVHDVGGYLSFTPERSNELGLKSLRSARYLSVNTVMTIEPGVYFIPFLLEKAFKDAKIAKYFNESKIKEYYDVGGVRIEDNIVVTADGCENLTQGLPRTVEEIEKVMAGTS